MDKYEIKTHTIPYQFNVEDWLLFAITVAASALLYYFWLATYGVVGRIVVTGMCISAIGIEVKRLHVRTRHNIQRQADHTAKSSQGLFDDAPLLITQMKEKVESAAQHVNDAEQEYRDRAFAPFWDSVESATKILYQYNVHANDLSNSIFDDAPLLITQMKEKVESAAQYGNDAEREYRDRAFAPFWDSVECATKILYQYNVHANDLSNSIKDYKGLIDRLTEKIPP